MLHVSDAFCYETITRGDLVFQGSGGGTVITYQLAVQFPMKVPGFIQEQASMPLCDTSKRTILVFITFLFGWLQAMCAYNA